MKYFNLSKFIIEGISRVVLGKFMTCSFLSPLRTRADRGRLGSTCDLARWALPGPRKTDLKSNLIAPKAAIEAFAKMLLKFSEGGTPFLKRGGKASQRIRGSLLGGGNSSIY